MKLINLALFGSAIAGLPLAAASAVLEEVVVVAHPLSAEGLAQASEVLEGDELARKATINLGSTLANEPGIHGAPFGSGVGRPVIHGLAGPRVKIMEDRIDTLDVSVTSADHATTVDPFIAERVEVLKGASTLLYGSGAIGGVVDVHTGRIPHDKVDGLLKNNGTAFQSRFRHQAAIGSGAEVGTPGASAGGGGAAGETRVRAVRCHRPRTLGRPRRSGALRRGDSGNAGLHTGRRG